jgi:7,8-dihydropterin-6-yl-methyl-4-(beta-D-ribofuranosyl)aminobenzene 5'-phosphate synthase
VLTGCAHAGIVNILKDAERLFPGRTIHTVIGGFHLNNANDTQMCETINCFKRVDVQYVAALHCTGYHAQKMLMDALKDRLKRAFGDL